MAIFLNGCSGGDAVSGDGNNPDSASHPEQQPVSEQQPGTEQVSQPGPESSGAADADADAPAPATGNVATFGSGCFWCTEAIFDRMEGVQSAVSGYMGGTVENPSYELVCTGTTGHAEVVQVTYDPEKVSYETLLEVFWKTHDPTTRNRQGADTGTQYRSAVFFHNESQQASAAYYMKKLDESGAFANPIVTEITAAAEFYPAEKYHQDYFANNPGAQYCAFVIAPKVEKFEKVFGKQLKK
ncbi:MAG: peptide-methionine (S)-S-oxide reductase MsrA [Planctomycetales bacterium]|nr:peptide-methionine (S)-S-oxide reductase MsrA [Planctomycetales bacterium]